MGTVSTFTFTSSTETVTSTKLNNLVANLLTEFNGSIEAVNIANTTITAAKLANNAVDLTSAAVTGILPAANAATTPGTVGASEIVTADANKDTTGQRNVTITGSYIIGSASMDETDLEKLDGITNGTQAAAKCVVADANVNTGISKVTELHIGASGSETQVTSTADELNTLDGYTGDVGDFNLLSGATNTAVQVVSTISSAVATGTTTMPNDDTIPQITEGNEFMTLAITPKNASNILVIEVVCNIAYPGAGFPIMAALFQDSTANALAAVMDFQSAGSVCTTPLTFNYTMTAGTTSPTTFRVRGGSSSAGTLSFNGVSGSRKFGGVMASSIVIREYSV